MVPVTNICSSMVPELLSSVTFCVAVAPLTIAVAVALCVNVGTYTPKVSCHDWSFK